MQAQEKVDERLESHQVGVGLLVPQEVAGNVLDLDLVLFEQMVEHLLYLALVEDVVFVQIEGVQYLEGVLSNSLGQISVGKALYRTFRAPRAS